MSKFFGWFKKNKNQTEEQVKPPESDTSGASHASNDAAIHTESHPESQHEARQEKPAADTTPDAPNITASEVPSVAVNELAPAAEAPDAQLEESAPVEESASIEKSPASEESASAEKVQAEEAQATESPVSHQEQPQEQPQEKPKEKTSFFSRLKRGLAKTKANIGSGFANLFSGKKIDEDLFEELETQLLMADLGVETTTNIIDKLTESAKRSELKSADTLYPLLKEHMSGLLEPVSKPLDIQSAASNAGPYVILMVGVNGVGKTTTIGKMAKQFQAQGKKVMLAAGDTFRAAAVEQLKVWGERNQIPVIAQATGSDSASVIFDAVQSAQARGMDILIADTAGRLQNKNHLMEELKKIVRVMQKLDPQAPHEIMLTIDASTGQNAISQTALFQEAVGLTGITLTKLDGTAKGGVIFALAEKFQIPIRFIGIGEGIDDLRHFNGQDFVDALFDTKDD